MDDTTTASTAPRRRVGSPTSKTRALIVQSTARLMLDEGYAAVTYRSVAAQAGVTAGLVQYYFPTLDALFVAVLRQLTEGLVEQLEEAFQAGQPLRSVWDYASNPTGAALLVEFMALANHRKDIWNQLGEGGERIRRAQLQALNKHWDDYGIAEHDLPPAALLFMLTSIGRMARLEEAFGTRTGHDEAITIVERLLDALEPKPAKTRSKGRAATRRIR
jgi:AcrR family transcriptional regulator